MQIDSLLEAFIVLAALATSAIWLRSRSTILQSEQGVFARLVTDFALPAVIFANLSREPFSIEKLFPALLLFCAIAVVMLVAWLIGRALKLDRPVLGSVILVSGVGSTSTLGYALIHHIFGDNTEVMSQVVIMGEFGVVLPLFIFGVAIAIYFGEDETDGSGLWTAAKSFSTSPIFISMALGLAVSSLDLRQDHWTIQLLNDFLAVASDSLALLVAFTIGLMLRPIAYRKIVTLIVLVALLKLILEPLIAGSIALALGVSDLQRELLVVEAAMPSGALAAVLAARYGCDAAVASALLMATYILSLLALPLIAYFSF